MSDEEEFDWEAMDMDDFKIEKAGEHSDEEILNTEELKPEFQV